MIAVRVCHAFECFYFGIDMLNNHPIPREPFIERFLPFWQLMMLAWLFRYPAVTVLSPDTRCPRLSG